tara:strand:+ start:57682 stop:58692 length:1011 start_codon:yes stop_codon:yes gene_type:complete
MPTTRPRPGLLIALLSTLLLGACTTPQFIEPTPINATPTLTEDVFKTRDGLALPYRTWMPEGTPRAVIVALHGFNDYSRFFEDAGQFLAARGIASYAYDQRGFGAAPHPGRWFPLDGYLADAVDIAKAIGARHPDVPLYLLGESMGGAIAMTALARHDAPWVQGAILSAPAVWGRDAMPWFQRSLLWLAAHTVPGMTLTGRGLDIEPSDNHDMLRALGRDPLVIKATRVDAIYGLVDLMDAALAAASVLNKPALILYGARDEVIEAGPTRLMIKRLPAGMTEKQRIAVYSDGYHMLLRDLQAKAVWTDIAHWASDPRAPLPSGADQFGDAFFAAEK